MTDLLSRVREAWTPSEAAIHTAGIMISDAKREGAFDSFDLAKRVLMFIYGLDAPRIARAIELAATQALEDAYLSEHGKPSGLTWSVLSPCEYALAALRGEQGET